MNGQRFHQQKRVEMKTEQCERSLNKEKSIGNSSKFDRDFISLDCFDCIQVYSFWFA